MTSLARTMLSDFRTAGLAPDVARRIMAIGEATADELAMALDVAANEKAKRLAIDAARSLLRARMRAVLVARRAS